MEKFKFKCVYLEFSPQKNDGKESKEGFLVTFFIKNGKKQRTRKHVDVEFTEEASGVCITDSNQLMEMLTEISEELGEDGWDLFKYRMNSRPAVLQLVFHKKVNEE